MPDTETTTKIRPINLGNLKTFADELKAKYAKKSEVTAVLGTATDDATKNTVYGAKAAAKAAQDAANAKVASVTATAGAGIEVAGTATAPTVGIKLSADADNELVIKTDEGKEGLFFKSASADDYTVVKLDTASSGASSSYQLQKNGTGVGAVIDIPKDMVVSTGEVQTFAEAGEDYGAAGTYIVLTIANKAKDKLYIPVDSLIEYVTSGSAAGDMVVVDVSKDHKVTATITDGTITLAKLDSAVQTTLGYVGNKAVSEQINDAVTALNLDTTYVKTADIEEVTEAEVKALLADETTSEG